MVLKVCIVCDELIDNKDDQVDYGVFASFYKYDRYGSIFGQSDKHIVVSFHKKCFSKYKKAEKKQDLYFTQTVGAKRIVIMDMDTSKPFQG